MNKTDSLFDSFVLFLFTRLSMASERGSFVTGSGLDIFESNSDADIVRNTTNLLDLLLSRYDRRIRPGFGGEPVLVDVNLNVRSMGPISELEMSFQMDLYFRQSWVDRRLAFSGSPLRRLQMSVTALDKLWTPDTFFHNGRRSYLHTVTVPNKFLRLNRDGRILYSMRLTIRACCPMHLENFPLDTQSCPLQIGSHGYNVADVLYQWTDGAPIQMSSDMTLSQFDLVSTAKGNETIQRLGGRLYSVLNAKFILRRHMGYFLINVYVPCSILVIISWVGFWINREATADRIALGVTTVLTMAFLGIDNRRDLPKVSYSTALDYFVGVCFGFVSATILQFAGVHFFTKHESGEMGLVQELERKEQKEEEEDRRGELEAEVETELKEGTRESEEDDLTWPRMKANARRYIVKDSYIYHSPRWARSTRIHDPDTRQRHVSFHSSSSSFRLSKQRATTTNTTTDNRCLITLQGARHRLVSLLYCLFRDGAYAASRGEAQIQDGEPIINSVSRIDKLARLLFPAAFVAFHIFYWISYINSDGGQLV